MSVVACWQCVRKELEVACRQENPRFQWTANERGEKMSGISWDLSSDIVAYAVQQL